MDVQDAVDTTEGVHLELEPDGASQLSPQHRFSIEIKSERDIMESSEELLFVEVRPPVFALLWLGMLCIHTFCGVVLALQAHLYLYMTSPYLSYYAHLITPNIVRKYCVVAAVFTVLSVVHWLVVLQLCYYSLVQRKFAFFPANHYNPPKPPASSHSGNEGSADEKPLTAWTRFTHRLHACHVSCFSRRGLLGVESPFFYAYFYLRECIELSSQIYQAYRASVLVARPWLNNLSVAVIVVNCFSTPLVQLYYKKHPATRRTLLLAIDAVLDFCVAIVVPVSIFAPYARAFDLETKTFPSEKLYDHHWFINAILENQEVFVISNLDLVFKIIPHLSIRGCLKKVRALVRKDTSVLVTAAPVNGRVPVSRASITPLGRSMRFKAKIDQFRDHQQRQEQPQTQGDGTQRLYQRSCRRGSRLVRKYAGKLIRMLFVLIGCAVLLFHGLAFRTSYYGDKSGCRQIMRPWFATKLACSVYQTDCSRIGILGNASQVTQILAKLQSGSVAALLFTHCPALEIPTIITQYHHLMSVDVYNSTLVSWPQEAALRQSSNPLMASLSLIRVNFSTDGQLPEGLTSDDFPRGLFDVEISTTNLVELPGNLHKRWPAMTKFFVENSQLTEFPSTLSHLSVEKLSLEGNRIERLPEELFYDQSYFIMALSNNPLVTLPSSADDQTYIRYLHVHGTNVTVFPSWIYDKLSTDAITRIYAHDTPFCTQQSAQQVNNETHGVGADITCLSGEVADPLDDTQGMYPLRFMDSQLGRQ
ncbi:hypothetical protein Gpo141_00001569 [Globisporangium polare]